MDNKTDFIKLYQEFAKTLSNCQILRNEGRDDTLQTRRLRIMELRVNRDWTELSDQERAESVLQLIASGHMPAALGEALRVFEGKVVSVV